MGSPLRQRGFYSEVLDSDMEMANAEQLLQAAVTFRAAESRTDPLPDTFATASDAVAQWMSVLLPEAKEALREPMTTPPDHPYLHPVDVDTDAPGKALDIRVVPATYHA